MILRKQSSVHRYSHLALPTIAMLIRDWYSTLYHTTVSLLWWQNCNICVMSGSLLFGKVQGNRGTKGWEKRYNSSSSAEKPGWGGLWLRIGEWSASLTHVCVFSLFPSLILSYWASISLTLFCPPLSHSLTHWNWSAHMIKFILCTEEVSNRKAPSILNLASTVRNIVFTNCVQH